MKKIISIYILTTLLLFMLSCTKEKCQTCTKTIGGAAGNITAEIKTVCDEKEAQSLENSSQSTTVWECK